MTKKEMIRLQVVESLTNKTMILDEVSKILGLSQRRVSGLKKGVKLSRVCEVVRRNKARKLANAISDNLRPKIEKLKK